MKLLEIPATERGLIRVFAVNLPADEVTTQINATSKAAVAQTLFAHPLPDTGFDLFPLADLESIGLAGYLTQGYGVTAQSLKLERARLNALDGYVLLVFSSAFEGNSTTVQISPDLSHITTFGETLPDMQSIPLNSDAAKPFSGVFSHRPAPIPPRSRSGALVVAALVVIVGLILWVVLR